jgi:hypothetical protein
MTILIVVAVLLLSVRIAVLVSLCVLQRYSGRVLSRPDDRRTEVNRQTMTFQLPAQDCMTGDRVSVRVDAVVSFRVGDSAHPTLDAQDYRFMVAQLAQASLRSLIGATESDELLSRRDPRGAGGITTPRPGPVGPRDAPSAEPQDAVTGPRDAYGRPQDAALGDVTTEPAEAPVAVAKGPSAPTAARERATARKMRFVKPRRGMPVPPGAAGGRAALDRTIIDSVARPTGGPACLGGREDGAYLRGWDDAVDWIGQGNHDGAPTWGGVAYMTGWNDAVRAVAKARREAERLTAATAA